VINERKAVDQLKSEFISTVSHELRTPLTSIRGALGLLASGALVALPAQAKNLVDVALRNSERLTALVNDILDVERISSDNLNLNLEQLDLIALANLAMNDNEIYAQQLGIRFIPQVNGVALVNADSNRVQQIFANLMTNSIKFSNKGGEIHVTVMQKTETVRVEIKDFGSGIPVEFQPRIFGRFAQADSADTRQHGGTGLGLNISKALVEKMGGTIGFSSEKDIGTVFWFELPKA
jgi:signal transduction histidine kinase